jgi:hypothetical protein
VFGEDDEVGMTPAERSTLEACPTTRLHFVPNCGHMLPNQRPDWVAELIVDTLTSSGRPSVGTEEAKNGRGERAHGGARLASAGHAPQPARCPRHR